MSVTVSGDPALTEETGAFVRERLEAKGHVVDESAPHAMEIEIESVGGVVRAGSYLWCVKLRGRVVSEQVVEKCDYVRFTNVGPDPVTRTLHVVLAAAKAVSLERQRPDAQSALYTAALAELTDTLGRQAMRRD